MLNMLNMTVWEYLKENVVLTVALAIILALIVALSGVMIYLQLKVKKNPPEAEEDKSDENPEGEESESEPAAQDEATPTEEKKADETPAEEAKKQPEQETVKEESKPEEEKKEEAEQEEPKQEDENADSRWNGFRDGKWIIRKTKEGKFVFKLYAANGSVMLDSNKEYSTLSSAKSGIETYKKNLEDTNNCKIVSTKAGHFVYRITYANGMLLAVSSNYTSKANCENALELTRKYAAGAPVEVLTD